MSLKEELTLALKAAGLSYTEDSLLQKAYINGKSPLSLHAVVNKVAHEKYLREYTQYQHILSELYENNIINVQEYRYTRTEMMTKARCTALELDPVPRVWPWLGHQTAVDKDGFTLVKKRH